MTNRLQQIRETAAYISAKMQLKPRAGLILGSGLGVLADEIDNPVTIPFGEIPHFPASTVAGHAGKLVMGMLSGTPVIAMQGRFHYYEGHSMQTVIFPVYVMRELGVETLIVTNACGGMNRSFAPGDLMIITDHINMMGDNPLIGPNLDEFGPRFPDMSSAYTPELVSLAEEKAEQAGIVIHKGVCCGASGPTYLTPSELAMLARLGGDAIGMSTVPEVIAASHCGLKVLGISCVTDMAIGEELEPLTHEQVVAVANRTRPRFIALMRAIIQEV
ncbi:purine-nucleoside phosphorylase [Brevibacillus humidisoli]|uniref:purine-nucleoside phosphorylase n=1 Tax=Brevibacillus humidisoli TaxID=2895522 RepID=UPI001E527126|nr:purine-nucleoside phosphorylase [Brevibacillus humidisoli]UFJ42868.1 purine-nucleoside phosphorylase [Brevibacillus humidisoli]